MDATYYWQKAAICLRLAQTLSADNPGRLSLIEMGVGFERRAKEEVEKAKIKTAQMSAPLQL